MSESTETAPSKKSLLNRSFLIKVIPVGLFAVLGTFAVIQSILGEKNAPAETEQVAGDQDSGNPPRGLLSSEGGLLSSEESASAGSPSEQSASEARITNEPGASDAVEQVSSSAKIEMEKPPVLSDLKLVRTGGDGAITSSGNPVDPADPAPPALEPPPTSNPANPGLPTRRPGNAPEFKLTGGTPAAPSASASFGDQPQAQTSKNRSDSSNFPGTAPVDGPSDSGKSAAQAASAGGDLGPVSRSGPPSFGAGMENVSRKSGDFSSSGFAGQAASAGNSPPNLAVASSNFPTNEKSLNAGPPSGLPSTVGNSLRDAGAVRPVDSTSPLAPPQVNSFDAKSPVTSGPTSSPNNQIGPTGFSASAASQSGQEAVTASPATPASIGSNPSPAMALPPANPRSLDRVAPAPGQAAATQPFGANPMQSGPPPVVNPGSPLVPGASANSAAMGLPVVAPPVVVPPTGNPLSSSTAQGASPAAVPAGVQQSLNQPSSPVSLGNNANLVRDSLQGSAASPAGAGLPGKAELEGEQVPALSIEKVAPREIQIDQPADFKILVKNVGRVVANEVRVTDQVPRGAQFIKAVPEASRGASGGLVWELGALKPGEERSIVLTLQPKQTGEIGSVAQVTFATPASMRVMVTKPQLAVEHTGPAKVTIGDKVPLSITVRNLGNGPAKDVILQETVPPQLKFAEDFNELEYEIGTLAPGQSRKINLNLSAAQIGRFRNTILVSGQGGLHAEHQIDMEVIAPQLNLSSEGPNRRFLKRNATHVFSIRNSGTAIATNLDLVAKLPRGVKFVSANNQGQYDPGSNAVYWSLDRLNVSQAVSVQLTTTPIEIGEQNIEFIATADLDQKANLRQPLLVEDLVELFFEIDDVDDVIEVGSETRYRVRLMNQGTVMATNIQLTFTAEQGIRPVSVDNRLAGEVRGQEVVFAPIAEIRPGEVLETFITATAAAPGEHRVVARLRADQREMNVSKEESTRVYADR